MQRIDPIVGQQLCLVASRVAGQTPLVVTQPQRQIGRPIPDDVAFDLQVGVGGTGAGDVRPGIRCAWPINREMLPLALHVWRVVDDVVVNKHVAVRDWFAIATNRRSTPAIECQICTTTGGGTGVAITRAQPKHHFDGVANGAHVVERVVRQQNVVAAIDSHPRPSGIVDDVVDEFDVVGFIMQPRRDHVFKPGALAGHIAPHSAIVDFVAFDADIGRAPFGVHTPVAGIVDDVALDVAVLHCHKVNIVVISTTDVVIFDIDIL